MDQTECPFMLNIINDMYPGNLPTVDPNVEPLQTENIEHSIRGQSHEQYAGSHSEHTTEPMREKKPRTPVRASVTLSKINGKLKCRLENGLIQPSSASSRVITRIFKERLEASSWAEISAQTKDLYSSEFQSAWDRKAGGRYKDMIYNYHKGRVKNQVVDDETKKGWEVKWNTPEFKKRSEINSKNRNTENGPILHTSGSIGFDEYSSHLVGKLTRPCTPHELFLATHMSKEDCEKFTDERDKTFDERYHKIRAEKLRLRGDVIDDKDFMGFEEEVYMEAVGENKNYIYGLGNEGIKYKKRKHPSRDSAPSILSQTQVEEIMTELHEMRVYKEKYHNLKAEMQEEIQNSVEARLESITQQQQAMNQQWMQMQRQMQHQMEQQMSQQLQFGPLTNMIMQAQQPMWMMPRRMSPSTSSPSSTSNTSRRVSPDAAQN